jgi:murein DD-endopeptidase MepM/ murein hydrolase activator NlpD
VDIAVAPGTPIYAPEAGKIMSVNGRVYSDPNKAHKRLVMLVSEDTGFYHYLMYVKASQGLKMGAKVKAGDLIGYAQGLQDLYPGITDHIHWEIRGTEMRVDPILYLQGNY